MDKFDRIFALHQLFAGRRTPISIAGIQARLDCGRATAYRLVELMRDQLGAPIVKDAKTGGLYYQNAAADDLYQLPGLWFSAAELQSLMVFHRLLHSMEPGLLEEHLAPLGRKLEQLLAHRRLNLGNIAQRIRVLGSASRATGKEFRTVASATLQRARLHLTYHSRSKDQHTQRVASPQRLVHYRDNWYLDVWDHEKRALRSFSVDRILAARQLAERAHDVPEADLDEHFSRAYGIFAGAALNEAVLRFTAERARWVADERWHPQQLGQFLTDGRYELRVPYGDARELVMDILRHGADVEVVAPNPLRDAVAEQHRRALEQYSGLREAGRSDGRIGSGLMK